MKLIKALAFVAIAAAVANPALAANKTKKKAVPADKSKTTAVATPALATNKVEMKTAMDSIAYSVGTNWGTMMKTDDLNLNLDVLKQGMEDAIKGTKLALTDEQIATYFKQLSEMVQAKKQKEQAARGAAAKAEGTKFLADNAKRKGISSTPSGLQYEVLAPGKADGKKPTATSKVKVHYTGTLINGKKFDSSYDRNEPIEFELNRVIPGWTEGVQLMSEGSKFKFYVPSEIGYGERGAGADIGPNETLIFEVELLEVQSNPKI